MQALIGKDFPARLIQLVDEAKAMIDVVVFDWRWYPYEPGNPVQKLNQAFIRAARRGVKVRAISNCDAIIKVLKENGIEAKKSASKNLIHAKMVVIDGVSVVLGSHNFSQAAFTTNHEISVFLPDAPDILPFCAFFNSLWQL